MRPRYQDETRFGVYVCVFGVGESGPGRISDGLLITPLVARARKWTKMADGFFDFTYHGLVIRSTLRALL